MAFTFLNMFQLNKRLENFQFAVVSWSFCSSFQMYTKLYLCPLRDISHTSVSSANTELFKNKVFVAVYRGNARTWETEPFTVLTLHKLDYFPHFLPYVLLNQELLNLCPCREFNLIKAHSQERQILYLVSKCSLILPWCCCIMDAYFTLTFQSVFFS